MNDGRLEGGPINGAPVTEALNAELRNVERSESYDMEDCAMEEGPTEDRVDRGEDLMERLTYEARTVVIEPMHYGYVVKLDCHKFAFESADRALKYITEYLKDPQGTEQKWWKHELFK